MILCPICDVVPRRRPSSGLMSCCDCLRLRHHPHLGEWVYGSFATALPPRAPTLVLDVFTGLLWTRMPSGTRELPPGDRAILDVLEAVVCDAVMRS